MTTFSSTFSQIASLYVGYFGRAGDPAGQTYWSSQIASGALTLAQVAASFSVQPESLARYPYLANPQGGDPGAFVDQVYQNMFNHAADPAGKAYWVGQLQAAQGNPQAIGAMILNIISGATGVDDTTIVNKVDVAVDFSTKAASSGSTWTTAAATQSATEITATNSTQASVTAAKLATDVYFSTAPGPQFNFTLTGDAFTTTAQNANFNAPLLFNAPTGTLISSLQTGDSAIDTAPLTGPGLSNGGTFTATLNGFGVIPLVTLRGIPTHTVTSLVAGGYSGNITGLTTLTNLNSTAALTIGAAGNGIDSGGVAGTTTTGSTLLGTVNITNVAGGATTILVNTAALAGAADALAINVVGTFGGPGGAQNTVSVKNDTAIAGATDNAYETITINASGATFMALADATSGILSTTRINVEGAGAVALFGAVAGNFANLTTINAVSQSGGLTITGANTAGGLLAGNTVLSSFKGGTGADSLDITSMSAAQVQAFTAGNLDGGAGAGRDTLIITSGAATGTVALNNSGFEIIGITGLAGTVDFSKFGSGVDTLTLSSAQTAAAIFNNLASGLTVALGSNAGPWSETFNSAGTGGADVITVTHNGIAAGNLAALAYTGFETINLNTALVTGSAAVSVASITAVPSSGTVTLNLNDASTGSLSFGAINVGAGVINVAGAGTGGVFFNGVITASAINASQMAIGASNTGITMAAMPAGQISILGSAGVDTLWGSTVADLINGGGGNDFIDAEMGGDVMTGGTGSDTFGGLISAADFGLQGYGVAASASFLTAAVAVGQTIVFGSGQIGVSNVDRVTDFVSGVDKADVTVGGVAPTSLIGGNATAAGVAGQSYVLYGNYVGTSGVFTVAAGWSATTADALFIQGSGTVFNASSGWVVMTGLNQALVGADFF